MDRMLYVAMTGGKQILEAQATVAHNLANVNTIGFRADLQAFGSQPIQGPGFATRVNAINNGSGASFEVGALTATGRDLDVAIKGEGWLAVQGRDGTEGYTRAGNLRLTPDGTLETATGLAVLGDGGPISVPPADSIQIGGDGTVSIISQGTSATTAAAVARLKLVNPPTAQLVKGIDGLLRLRDGTTAPADAAVNVVAGSLESSNVNAAKALVDMIEFARLFDMQIKMIAAADQNAQVSQRLLQAA